MKVVQLNAVCGVGSTGGITVGISEMLSAHDVENCILYTVGGDNYGKGIKYSNTVEIKLSALASRIFGNYGFNSFFSTCRLIDFLKKYNPDIIHLHNIHGHDLNLDIFFKYLRKINKKVVWTFHDCWAFTGYCTHFDLLECNKWKTECYECPQRKRYSYFADRSHRLFNKKKELFLGIENLTIVSPSQWLAEITRHSFLNEKRIEVINNGIDLEIFTPVKSDFKEENNIKEKIILGIPKGDTGYFLKLNEIIDKSVYKIVLVGIKEEELHKLPGDIIGLPKIKNRKKMAEIFSAADVYVNTTLEDTFPTVNLEALACGTPVVTFNTGGSPEAVDDNTGIVVEKRNVSAIYEGVKNICTGPDRSEACAERARRLYNGVERFEDYYKLYLELMK